jgi:hypothetical protein
MVKPAMPYLDIIADAAQLTPDHPIACYQVSGEFAMIHAGAAAGVYDLKTMAFESVESMVRAGMCYSVQTAERNSADFKTRCHTDSVIFHSRFLGLAVIMKTKCCICCICFRY